jgi:CBS domain-containing protein
VRAVDQGESLEAHGRRLADAARRTVESGAGALDASREVAHLNDVLTRRLLVLAESELGPPPCPYGWLALGSQGRMEQALLTDQDNAVAYADDAAGSYFAALAGRVVEGLRRAGLQDCPGGYMATNWHRPLSDWRATFREWLDRPSSPGVVEAEVFLDFRRVHGELNLDPLDAIVRSGADRPRFLILMARAAVTFRPPLRFGRIHPPQVDLKRSGIAPIVLLARLYALAGGSLARHTLDRVEAAAASSQLSHRAAAQLSEAYRVLTELRLDGQLRASAAGRPPTNVVSLEELTAEQRSQLTDAFRVVREYQQVTELHFRTDVIT